MKTKILVASLLVFGLVASMAVAAPAEKGRGRNGSTTSTTSTTSGGPGKSKGKAKQACKPSRSVVLRGEFVASGAGGFAMDVKGGNKVGKSLVGKQVTVLVDEHTKLRRHGKAELADFVAGDRLKVQGKACKVDAVAMTVLARRVVGKPAKAEQDGETTTTTTTTSTTETSTTETDATGE
jgi:hypothetical protein